MDDLDKHLRGLSSRAVKSALGRTARLNVLVTPQQKDEIRATAERYGLSMTDYLLRLHALAETLTRPTRR